MSDICPKCGGKATKIMYPDKDQMMCQQCDHIYDIGKYDHKQLYKLKVHKMMWVADDTKVVRVPGGWIYNTIHTVRSIDGSFEQVTSVFVPYHNEFQFTDTNDLPF